MPAHAPAMPPAGLASAPRLGARAVDVFGGFTEPAPRRHADARALRRLHARVAVACAGMLCMALVAERAAAQGAPLAALDSRVTQRVVDGDTLITGDGTRWRIYGIDAPESSQWCRADDGRRWPCGQRAARAMRRYAPVGSPIDCRQLDRDRYGRSVGVCTANGQDIAQRLVEAGLAVEYQRYSDGRYASAEASAQRAAQGLHSGCFTPPPEWRRGDRRCGRD